MSNNKDNIPNKQGIGRLTISNNVLEALSAVISSDFVHVREISRLAGISPTTASMLLKELEENGILTKKTLGRNCFYSMNRCHKTLKLIAMLENYRFLKECSKSGFLAMSESLLDDMGEIKGFIDSVVAYKEDSGYSIVFITSLDNDTIRSKIRPRLPKQDIGKVSVFTKENFRNNINNEMIKNILKSRIIIFGAERFIDLLY